MELGRQIFDTTNTFLWMDVWSAWGLVAITTSTMLLFWALGREERQAERMDRMRVLSRRGASPSA